MKAEAKAEAEARGQPQASSLGEVKRGEAGLPLSPPAIPANWMSQLRCQDLPPISPSLGKLRAGLR